MNKITTNQTLEIKGKINSYTRVAWRVGWAAAFVGLGIFLWLQGADERYQAFWFYLWHVVSLIIAAFLPFNEHTYLDFTDRQIVTLKHYAWFEISKRSLPLTDFRNIVVRHLFHDSEYENTYTASVGLKPVDGGPVLEVKSFPASQKTIPRTAYEFARKLQDMTGLPGATEPIACVRCGTMIPGDAMMCLACGAHQKMDPRRARLWLEIIKGH